MIFAMTLLAERLGWWEGGGAALILVAAMLAALSEDSGKKIQSV
jgi:drug/metabolite transporter (DMT)-like permease